MNKTRCFFIWLYSITFVFLLTLVFALNLARVKTWSASEILTAADLNAEFNNILNHSITNNDISASAAIQASKIDFTVSSAIGSTTPSTGAFTTLSATGDVTLGNGAGDNITLNFPDGFTFTPAATWTFTAAQTVAGTWADLGIVTTVDINGGTIDGITALSATGVSSFAASADLDIGSYELRAQTFESDVVTGTAPLVVASTTKVSNLNADTLDGLDSTNFTQLVDRGDPAAVDFNQTSLTLNDSWQDLDLSSIVPAGATSVLLFVSIKDAAVNANGLHFRKNGNSNVYNISSIYNQVINVWTSSDITVFCDTNRVIEYKGTNGEAYDSINITVKGWNKGVS